MKKFIIFFAVILLASCGQNASQNETQNIPENSTTEKVVKTETEKSETKNISENQKTETTKIEEKFDRKDEIVKWIFIAQQWENFYLMWNNEKKYTKTLQELQKELETSLKNEDSEVAHEMLGIAENVNITDYLATMDDAKWNELINAHLLSGYITTFETKTGQLHQVSTIFNNYENVVVDVKTGIIFEKYKLLTIADRKDKNDGLVILLKSPIGESDSLIFVDKNGNTQQYDTQKFYFIKKFSILEDGNIEIEYFSDYTETELFEPQHHEKNSITKKAIISEFIK